ncbi:site-specific integrase [Natrinema versiforme]|uniref:Putative phage integrase n=1 Tax=Natrinema versiforme JCM 10478 TaxID=1227496 RepID=L9Y6Q6_9EURY|nr:hypothetical protein [Natrinema versiforme]ELY69336.1 putative phage integrase [Natrinema versiforme JCM 10478]
MQTRPYEKKEGKRIWLNREEQDQLLSGIQDQPRLRIALQLGLHGLRTDEIVRVEPGHLRDIETRQDGTEKFVLEIPKGKTGAREVPIDADLKERINYLKAADQDLGKHDPIIDVSKRTLRNWIGNARDELDGDYSKLGMHDLRRTWATDTYYSLAFEGVPIAEELVMSWGGWKMTATGRETFRENYLGPVPDHVTAQALETL